MSGLVIIDLMIIDVTSKVVLWCLFCRGTIPDNLKKYICGEHSDLDKKQLLALGSRLVLILTSQTHSEFIKFEQIKSQP